MDGRTDRRTNGRADGWIDGMKNTKLFKILFLSVSRTHGINSFTMSSDDDSSSESMDEELSGQVRNHVFHVFPRFSSTDSDKFSVPGNTRELTMTATAPRASLLK